MSSSLTPTIVIAESSAIVRSGLSAVLRRMPGLNAYPVEVADMDALQNYVQLHTPDVVIVNPTFGGWFDLATFRAEQSQRADRTTRYVAVLTSVINGTQLRGYDDYFTIVDDVDTLTAKVTHLLTTPDTDDEAGTEQDMLSQREKEIITCVVKGMTNKAIADQLFLSIHTVITHRRNIARKLQIHSPAGLTIYAIVNKLVELQDVKVS